MKARWTAECEAHLLELYRAGASCTTIAASLALNLDFHVSKNAVIGKINRLQETSNLELRQKPTPPTRGRSIVIEVERPALPEPSKPNPWTTSNVPPLPAEWMQMEDAPFVSETVPEGAVTLVELTRLHCRYPFGISAHRTTYCGKPKREGCSYCEEHAKICLVKPPASVSLRVRRRPLFMERRREM